MTLADGMQLIEDNTEIGDDWTLSITEPTQQGTPILTVPSHLILSSDVDNDTYLPYYDEQNMRNVYTWMEQELTYSTSSSSAILKNYLPEFMLIYKLIQEIYLGQNSRWYAWWNSLPTTFSTSLYLDDIERFFVERMAGTFLYAQDIQYDTCLNLMKKLISSQQQQRQTIPTGFYQWLLELQQSEYTSSSTGEQQNAFDNLVKWAFSVVFTRSMRSPNKQHAQIVPIGDMANHDCQRVNLQPLFRPADNAFQFYLTQDLVENISQDNPGKLYLSYGTSWLPARYLVLFGFCDVSSPYVDAHLDFIDDDDDDDASDKSNNCKWPTRLQPSQLVISTTDGAVSDEVWVAFLYKVLQANDPNQLVKIRQAFGGYDGKAAEGHQLLDKLLLKWESAIAIEMSLHYQRLLETDFEPIMVTEQDLLNHPNIGVIVNYNLFMREIFISVLTHLNDFLNAAGLIPNEQTDQVDEVVASPTSFDTLEFAEQQQQQQQQQMLNTSTHYDNFYYPQPDNAVDNSMDSYTQALEEMASVNTENDVKPSQSDRSFNTASSNQNAFDGSSSSFESNQMYTDTSMDAYVQAINRSNGNEKDPASTNI